MKKTFISLVLFALAASGLSAWQPNGWVYRNDNYLYATASKDWYYKSPAWTQWTVNTQTGQWQSTPVNGWNFYQWPYFYSTANGAWYFTDDPGDEAWVVNMALNHWSIFGRDFERPIGNHLDDKRVRFEFSDGNAVQAVFDQDATLDVIDEVSGHPMTLFLSSLGEYRFHISFNGYDTNTTFYAYEFPTVVMTSETSAYLSGYYDNDLVDDIEPVPVEGRFFVMDDPVGFVAPEADELHGKTITIAFDEHRSDDVPDVPDFQFVYNSDTSEPLVEVNTGESMFVIYESGSMWEDTEFADYSQYDHETTFVGSLQLTESEFNGKIYDTFVEIRMNITWTSATEGYFISVSPTEHPNEQGGYLYYQLEGTITVSE